MPAAAIPFIWGAAISGGASVAAGVVGSRSSSNATKKAATAEQASNTEAIAFEREKEAQRIKEQERYDAEAKLQWEAEQKRLDDELARQTALDNATVEDRRAQFAFAKEQYANRQAQMAPYRQAGAGALAQLATLAGVASPTATAPKVLTEMPTNWQP
ncbi:MAG: hypothetical protein NTY02_05010, partial [Acidobacteria bacterium]|nr:hypothetical protein [Acidobacteriota bacterium]